MDPNITTLNSLYDNVATPEARKNISWAVKEIITLRNKLRMCIHDDPNCDVTDEACLLCLDPGVPLSRILEIEGILLKLPVEFAFRWCNYETNGPCACLGCANGYEFGAGNLKELGYTREEWDAWRQWKGRDKGQTP